MATKQRTMSRNSLAGILKHLHKLSNLQALTDLNDSELLERFLSTQEELAFTVLIERHGPMVHAVCCRTLGNTHDAEDACQATFLVLARKAQTIRKKRSLSSWLHGVALRLANSLKRKLARRQRREQLSAKSESSLPHCDVSWREVQAILDAELQQLPERYRSALILCYLEEKTRDEAAAHLNISKGSLHGLLQRGRNLLRERLQRRGISLSSALLVTALSQSVCQGGLPPTMVISSTKAAMAFSSPSATEMGVIAPHILSLTQEVLKVMFISKLKTTAQVLLSVLMIATLIGGTMVSSSFAEDEKVASSFKKKPKRDSKESDREFIRRLSLDLRGHPPTDTEVHFFAHSKDPNRRKVLVDLFIQERQAKKLKGAKEADFIRAANEADIAKALAQGLKSIQQAQLEKARAQELAAKAKLAEAQASEFQYANDALKKRLAELAELIEKNKKKALSELQKKELDRQRLAYQQMLQQLAASKARAAEALARSKAQAQDDARKAALKFINPAEIQNRALKREFEMKRLQDELADKEAQLKRLQQQLERALKKK